MTAMAILQPEEEGKLSVNDLLSKYMPELPNADKITIHQLLNHSSGLTDYKNRKSLDIQGFFLWRIGGSNP